MSWLSHAAWPRGSRSWLVASLVAVTLLARSAPAATPERDPRVLRVLAWNVFIGNRDVEGMARLLERARPDVAALIELSAKTWPRLEPVVAARFPHRSYLASDHGPGGWYGIALLSTQPFESVRHERSPGGRNGWSLAALSLGGRRLQLAALHLDPLPLRGPLDWLRLPWSRANQRESQAREIDLVLRSLALPLPRVVMGDFNGESDAPPAQRLVHEGLLDAVSSTRNDADDRATIDFPVLGIELGRRIDFVFHDPALETLAARQIDAPPSDHDAVLAVLRWRD